MLRIAGYELEKRDKSHSAWGMALENRSQETGARIKSQKVYDFFRVVYDISYYPLTYGWFE